MRYNTSLKDIGIMNHMFRDNILPLVGIEETIKLSKISNLFNKVIDYNAHNPPDRSLPYLQNLMINEFPGE